MFITTILSPVGVLLTMVILALLVSLAVMLRISSRMADNNARLIDQVTTLELSAKQQAQQPSLQQPPTEATQNCLYRWFDSRIDELRLFCQPDIDLKTTSQTLGITQRSIQQMLKTTESAPPTFSEYLTSKRLAYSCQLLKEKPNWNIDAVAHEAGIQSDATFRRLFRKYYGMSPSEYRERQRHT